ncbi:hypothetical protein WR25_04804 [Diploscapter pachys]|uniref:Protein kinase domain-containing protein n=1 Tax=Diploscapter pachys TaxID=2018661 RepID=A0A2A2LMZ9_9BILA|nr:hypothetical protein WR25_04804 [Diploscapter pachys]
MSPGQHSTGMLIRLRVVNAGNYTIPTSSVPPSTSPITTNNKDKTKTRKGAFSEVFLGVLSGRVPLFEINQSIEVQLNSSKSKNVFEVAVKRLLGHASESDRMDFFKEIEIMKKLEYNLHIVGMYGYVASKFVPLMLLEYCEFGDILHYVHENSEIILNNPSEIKGLTSYSWQICDGMSYIASKNIVHRDLAARNVLLTKSKVAKICDFGLAIYSNETINPMQKGLLPLKWLAPECYTENSFSTKSDV